ncbi:IS3 family transposase [Tenebrionibacter intestinalis]
MRYDLTNQKIMHPTVFYYIKCDYNRRRYHSAYGARGPEQFENQSLA